MAERMLIVGVTGFVGSRLARAARKHFEVIGGSRACDERSGTISLDITQRASVRRAFELAKPELVVHLAAMSDIDRCESERDTAEQVNYLGAKNVAEECARAGARLIYTSSDAVFDGTKQIYYEHDPMTPANWYGETKARAERAIAELLPTAAIVRVSLVLGHSALPGGNSYLQKVIGNLKAGNQIITPTFEYRNPIDVETLCELLLELAARHDATGIFHIGATDKMSRYDLARAIAEQLGYDPALIVPQTEMVPGRAPRGRDDFLVTQRVRQFCRTPIPTCRDVIERACHAIA